jgi:hypothetical protein
MNITTGEISRRLLSRGVLAPVWRVREVIDAHFRDKVVRVGVYRCVPDTLISEIGKICQQLAATYAAGLHRVHTRKRNRVTA